MKGTKEDIAKTIREVAQGMCSIADKIEAEEYNPEDWKELAGKFSNVYTCLTIDGCKFNKAYNGMTDEEICDALKTIKY